jgi:hypothetical protein
MAARSVRRTKGAHDAMAKQARTKKPVLERSDGEVRDVGEEIVAGREWDAASDATFERIDDRDGENIDLDIECLNESLERRDRG